MPCSSMAYISHSFSRYSVADLFFDSGFMHLAAGLSVGLTGLAAGYAIGVVGDVVRCFIATRTTEGFWDVANEA